MSCTREDDACVIRRGACDLVVELVVEDVVVVGVVGFGKRPLAISSFIVLAAASAAASAATSFVAPEANAARSAARPAAAAVSSTDIVGPAGVVGVSVVDTCRCSWISLQAEASMSSAVKGLIVEDFSGAATGDILAGIFSGIVLVL